MRPKLKLDNIRDLHDARYCAAVGISMLGFRLGLPSSHLRPTEVGEIMEWLSGPIGVAVFEDQPPHEVNAITSLAKCGYASLPIAYPIDWASDIDHPIIFRGEEWGPQSWDSTYQLASRFPSALLEMEVDEDVVTAHGPAFDSMVGRLLVRTGAPTSIYDMMRKSGVQPWGFSLGDLVEEKGGGIDYERCDAFVEAYFAVAD